MIQFLCLVLFGLFALPAGAQDPDLLLQSRKHASDIRSVAISPAGHLVASAGEDGSIRLWRIDGTPAGALQGHQGAVAVVRFTPDGTQVVSGGSDQTLRLWGLDGTLLKKFKLPGRVACLAFFPDGKNLAVGAGNWINLLSLEKGLVKNWRDPRKDVYEISVRPGGKQIMTVDHEELFGDGVLLWDLSGKQVGRYPVEELHSKAAVTDDGRPFTAAREKTTLWTSAGDPLRVFRESLFFRDSALSPTAPLVAVAGDSEGLPSDPGISIYNVRGDRLMQLGEGDSYISVAFSEDGRLLVAGGTSLFSVWRLPAIDPRLPAHTGSALCLAFSPDGRFLATGGSDGTLRLWDKEKKPVRSWKAHAGDLTGVAFRPDSGAIATVSFDGTLKTWNLEGTSLQTFKGHDGPVTSVAYGPDGKWLATGGYDKTVRLWDETGLAKTLTGHAGIVWGVATHPEGRLVASASGDKTVRLWQSTGELIKTLKNHNNWVWDVTFSRDGKHLASSGKDNHIRLWTADGQPVRAFGPHNGHSIFGVAFSPDGERLVSGGSDGLMRFWGLGGQPLAKSGALYGRHDWLYKVGYHPGGGWAAAVGEEGLVESFTPAD